MLSAALNKLHIFPTRIEKENQARYQYLLKNYLRTLVMRKLLENLRSKKVHSNVKNVSRTILHILKSDMECQGNKEEKASAEQGGALLNLINLLILSNRAVNALNAVKYIISTILT